MTTTNTVSTLLMVQRQNALRLRYFTEAEQRYLQAAVELERSTLAFIGEAAATQGDMDLTGTGKAKKLAARATAFRAEVEAWLKPRLAGFDESTRQLRDGMLRPKPRLTDADRIEVALRASEIRAGLRDLDPAEVELVYRNGDAETRQAIETAPPMIRRAKPGAMPVPAPLIRRELVAELAEQVLAEQNPEAAERIRELAEISGRYKAIATAAERLADEVAPASEPATKVLSGK